MASPEFPQETLPWADRDTFPQDLEERLAKGAVGEDDVALLERWREDGYLHFPGLLAGDLIDRLLEDYEKAWRDRPDVSILVEHLGVQPFARVSPRNELTHHHFRLLDFQDVSTAARDVLLHKEILRVLRLIFGETPVAMQSLFFEYGSEQRSHQDFPYVQAQILSHLIGCWIACEDVLPGSGPLFYYPGSQKIAKFDWGGGGLHYRGEDDAQVERFETYVGQACQEAGLRTKTLFAKKGDVIFWHAALVHGGSAATDRELTRRSLVGHYSTSTAYPRDRRAPHLPPRKLERNGGVLYLRPQQRWTDRAFSLLRRLRSS